LHPPKELDVLPNDETPSLVSDEDPDVPNESDQDKATRLRHNKEKHVRKQRVEHRQEAMCLIMLPSRIMKMKLLEGSLRMRLRGTRLLKIKTVIMPNKIIRKLDKVSLVT
jgi:hypothetical protein